MSFKKSKNQSIPPYFAAQNDIIWAGGYIRPRMAFGPFNYMLKNHCERYAFDLKQIHFGKPELVAFKFVEKIMLERHCEVKGGEELIGLISTYHRY